MPIEEIELFFPRLVSEGYRITSPESETYNCIAYAGGDETEKWDPDSTSGRYWPDEVPRTYDLKSFIMLYQVECGYEPCSDSNLEEGFEKIAIYWDSKKEVGHAARQKPSGKWTSKLGDWEDIEHNTLSGLEGEWYGTVAQILKRRRRD